MNREKLYLGSKSGLYRKVATINRFFAVVLSSVFPLSVVCSVLTSPAFGNIRLLIEALCDCDCNQDIVSFLHHVLISVHIFSVCSSADEG